MSTKGQSSDSRLDLRLPAELKETIKDAATLKGQSISGFAVSTLGQAAREIIAQETATRLSSYDLAAFVSLLDDDEIRPSEALATAARRYISHDGRR